MEEGEGRKGKEKGENISKERSEKKRGRTRPRLSPSLWPPSLRILIPSLRYSIMLYYRCIRIEFKIFLRRTNSFANCPIVKGALLPPPPPLSIYLSSLSLSDRFRYELLFHWNREGGWWVDIMKSLRVVLRANKIARNPGHAGEINISQGTVPLRGEGRGREM